MVKDMYRKNFDREAFFAAIALEKIAFTKPNVVGVGIGYKVTSGRKTKDIVPVVMVEKKKPLAALRANDLLPTTIDGINTDVIEVGRIVALKARTDKWRPAPGGVSIGHCKITAGTLGILVAERVTGTKLILSNNHVLANSNDAEIGDAIYQPGPADGGTEDDAIATLYKFERIDFGEEEPDCDFASVYVRFGNFLSFLFGSSHQVSTKKVHARAKNYVDAALAFPIDLSEIRDDILDIGKVSGYAEEYLGMKVQKSGRTTELTTGSVQLVDATVKVDYGGGKIATFSDQIITGYMSRGGDSGSLLVTQTKEPKAVGLLFAGSNTTTVYNPIAYIRSALAIDI